MALLLDVKEAAVKLFGDADAKNKWRVRKLIDDGEIKTRRIGRRVLIPLAEVQRYGNTGDEQEAEEDTPEAPAASEAPARRSRRVSKSR